MKAFLITVVATMVVMLVWSGPGVAGDPDKGARIFKKCATCHTVGEDAKNKIGPHLNGLAGREAGTLDGFNFSRAMKKSDIEWDEEAFEKFLANPRKFVPGNRMAFAGIRKEKQVEDLWSYLKRFNGDGAIRDE